MQLSVDKFSSALGGMQLLILLCFLQQRDFVRSKLRKEAKYDISRKNYYIKKEK